MNMDWTSIILAVLTLIGGCGWLIDRKKLRQEVAELRYAIQRISDCSHRSDCPVLDQLQRQQQGE